MYIDPDSDFPRMYYVVRICNVKFQYCYCRYLTEPVVANLGSCMKDLPFSELGGNSPVVAYFSASMIVVFPVPFGPRMSVNGQEKRINESSLSSPKFRMPRSDSLRIFDILAYLTKKTMIAMTDVYVRIYVVCSIHAVNTDAETSTSLDTPFLLSLVARVCDINYLPLAVETALF